MAAVGRPTFVSDGRARVRCGEGRACGVMFPNALGVWYHRVSYHWVVGLADASGSCHSTRSPGVRHGPAMRQWSRRDDARGGAIWFAIPKT